MARDKTNAMRILDRLHICYEVLTYDCPHFTDGVQAAAALGRDPGTVFKTLVAQGKSRAYHVLVLPVAAELDMKKAAAAAGEKSLELIPVPDILSVTGYVRGGCTAIGMKKALPTLVDRSAQGLPRMLVSGGKLGLNLELSPEDYLTACKGQWADLRLP